MFIKRFSVGFFLFFIPIIATLSTLIGFPSDAFSISKTTLIDHNYLQILSYILMPVTNSNNLSLSFLLEILIVSYLISECYNQLLSYFSKNQLIASTLFFIIILGGAAAFLKERIPTLPLFQGTFFLLFSYLASLITLDQNHYLIDFIPLTTKKLTIFLTVLFLAFALQNQSPILFIPAYFFSLIYGHVYARFKKKLNSYKTNEDIFLKAKVFDIQSGKPWPTEEEVLDSLLDKISQKGEAALTKKERQTLDALSKKKEKS